MYIEEQVKIMKLRCVLHTKIGNWDRCRRRTSENYAALMRVKNRTVFAQLVCVVAMSSIKHVSHITLLCRV